MKGKKYARIPKSPIPPSSSKRPSMLRVWSGSGPHAPNYPHNHYAPTHTDTSPYPYPVTPLITNLNACITNFFSNMPNKVISRNLFCRLMASQRVIFIFRKEENAVCCRKLKKRSEVTYVKFNEGKRKIKLTRFSWFSRCTSTSLGKLRACNTEESHCLPDMKGRWKWL